MRSITKTDAAALLDQVEKLLEGLEGAEVAKIRGSFGENTMRITLDVAFGSVDDAFAEEWKRTAHLSDPRFSPDSLGRTVFMNGRGLTLVGVDARARKFKVILREEKTGKLVGTTFKGLAKAMFPKQPSPNAAAHAKAHADYLRLLAQGSSMEEAWRKSRGAAS